MMKYLISAFIFLAFAKWGIAQETSPAHQAEELGQVNWLRSYDQAIKQAQKNGKFILILFQEVPGCATCRNYGHQVLSHPLVVETIESEFIPLAIFNNKSGKDAEVLRRFNEPSWNNPVVRIINHEGENVIDRISGNYSAANLLLNMKLALQSQSKLPQYLSPLIGEMLQEHETLKQETYSMYCFWTGEAGLGKLDGVIKTTPGFADNKEVVRLWYDPSILSSSTLEKNAAEQGFVKLKKPGKFIPDKEPQYYLSKSPYKYLALSQTQKSKINSLLAEDASAHHLLSPKQKRYLEKILENPDSNNERPVLYSMDFLTAWDKMLKLM